MKTNASLGLATLVVLAGCGLGWKLQTQSDTAKAVSLPPRVQQTTAPEPQRAVAPIDMSLFAGLPSARETPLVSQPLRPGDVAPDFELPDQNGLLHHLFESRGKTVVLSFYPQDYSRSCSGQVVSLSQAQPVFQARDTVVYGVSVQPVASKRRFADRFGIKFPLLADDAKAVTSKYGVLSQSGLSGRVTFVVGPDGKILSTDGHFHAPTHAQDVLSTLDRLHLR